ncbi:unnamed protein product, partial [Owenia fusiformis]
ISLLGIIVTQKMMPSKLFTSLLLLEVTIFTGQSINTERDIEPPADRIHRVKDDIQPWPEDTNSYHHDNFGLPGGPACMDLALVLDISCLDSEKMYIAKQTTKNIVRRLMTINGADLRISLVILSKKGHTIQHFNETDLDDISKRIDQITRDECYGSIVQLTIDILKNTTSVFARANYPNVVLYFTSLFENVEETAENMLALEVAGIELNIVYFQDQSSVNFTGRTSGLGVKGRNPGKVHIYDGLSEEDGEKLFQSLTSRFSCGGAADQRVCADLVFAIDVSCSIPQRNITRAVAISMAVARNLPLNKITGSQIGGLTYDGNIVDLFPYMVGLENGDPMPVLMALYNLRVKHKKCRTRTNLALDFVRQKYFTDIKDRHDASVKDVVVIFSDGMTSPKNSRWKTIAAASNIIQNGGSVIWVTLDNKKHRTNVASENEIKKSVSRDNISGELLIFDHADLYAPQKILAFLNQNFPCPLE